MRHLIKISQRARTETINMPKISMAHIINAPQQSADIKIHNSFYLS